MGMAERKQGLMDAGQVDTLAITKTLSLFERSGYTFPGFHGRLREPLTFDNPHHQQDNESVAFENDIVATEEWLHYPSHLIHQLNIRPDKLLQRALPLTHSLRERIRRQIRALRTGVSVILRVQRIRRPITQLLIHLRHRREMIHIPRPLTHIRRRKSSILHEPRRSIPINPSLPQIVRRLTADNHTRALGDVLPRRVGHVLVESVHERAVFARSAHLVCRAGAVAAAVV